MSRFINRTSIISVLVALTLVAAFASGVFLSGQAARASGGGARYGAGNNNPLCGRLGKSLQASQGANEFCFGPQVSTGLQHAVTKSASFGSNVNAANPSEDIVPSGVRAYGQSETSIAASGQYVVEAWNDSTGFFSPACSPMNKDQGTGFGFSNNGGKSFTDLGGLPNSNCLTSKTEGDPSVEAFQVGGKTYFYISSIFIPFNVPENALSVTACVVNGSGSSAVLSCGNPIVAAISSDCMTSFGFTFCSFLDKEFLSLDATRGRLYMSYTEFGVSTPAASNGIIELAVCDLSTPATPVCHNGSDGSITGTGATAAPYFVVAPGDATCENEGAYPAVDRATGDVYVAYEHNWASALFFPPCFSVPVKNVLNFIPSSCLTLTPTSACSGPAATNSSIITSMQSAFIPGYNRFPMNDFPRVATSSKFGTVSMVWNDVGVHPAGDILLQSFSLGTLSNVQSTPVRLNADTGGWHFLPALRYSDTDGNLVVSWYQRNSATTTLTNVSAALALSPRTTLTPGQNTKVTTGPSDWLGVSSDIVPNFGDYTDNYIIANSEAAYVAWSDGRLGVPQPFNAFNPDVDN